MSSLARLLLFSISPAHRDADDEDERKDVWVRCLRFHLVNSLPYLFHKRSLLRSVLERPATGEEHKTGTILNSLLRLAVASSPLKSHYGEKETLMACQALLNTRDCRYCLTVGLD